VKDHGWETLAWSREESPRALITTILTQCNKGERESMGYGLRKSSYIFIASVKVALSAILIVVDNSINSIPKNTPHAFAISGFEFFFAICQNHKGKRATFSTAVRKRLYCK